ncbi:MAG: LPS assembly lipoprotein LptE [Deltaproteobacteria bacterium]|nr:LPS assembly lipoprotein LptE [Deltaproteobacteria bacterium]
MRLSPQTPFIALLCLVLSGCGYNLAGGAPSVLGDGSATIYVAGLEQPTVLPWVSHILRSSLREEMAARNLAVWKEDAPADFALYLRVEQFTMRGAVKSSADANLLYTGSVSVIAIIHRAGDNAEVWRTRADYSNTFETDAEESAADLLFKQAARILAGNMRRAF